MSGDRLQHIVNRLTDTLKRDALVEKSLYDIREVLQSDRAVLYYFYRQWQGRVTCEMLSAIELSILGSTGPDECFNDEYAALYAGGRVRAIADIETEPIHQCHRLFLRSMKVRANLAVPILTKKGLWGLLIAHQCSGPRAWLRSDIEFMQQQADNIAMSPTVQDS
ncbi:MAG: GAF domain-containing protein [Microcoleus sp. PH2017_22_RUC_O_B]|uniref:GAF domain-containing protein n=1 Tax=unclassified Microcoleus TaxID=2642155 RepID=UPI001D3D666A|nr:MULTISPECIES: GAF domain-containing protein [unclassified Microcoleus]MCC3526885.1 GAF domain-containing protein [Microcoleus sp. PH2017_21_RUC_O_A]MCC3539106.1 GAF domain-containing protein [Microcoleus sp. PH2017_22_RUC_O_B]